MSGLAGVFYFDGRPAGPEPLGAVLGRLAHRGPDGCGKWMEGPVALGFQALHTTPESRRERQPLVAGAAALVFHGRIDNREELRAALGAEREATDADLALRACETWGEEAAGRILGEFAFAFWDGRNRRLVCARDWIGLRPFAYAADGARIVFASEPGALLADPSVPRVPNEGMIGEFLADGVTSRTETLWRGVLRLAPSHILIADAAGVRTKPYTPQRTTAPVKRSEGEDASHLRSIFREAVLCRLRSAGPVAADLSGGLDSSAVVGMVQTLYKEGAAAGKGFETFSEIFPGRAACDERPWIDEVVNRWGLAANYIEGDGRDPGVFAAAAAATLDFPGYPNSCLALPIRAAASQKGFRVVLSGAGSDEWFTGRAVRPLALLRAGAKALLPRSLQGPLAQLLGKRRTPDWIPDAFTRKISLADRVRARDGQKSPVPGAVAARRFARGFNAWDQHVLESDERDEARLGLEVRRPFLDRRVVEFALGVPANRLRRGAVTKFVLREALGDLLPPAVRDRRTKADFSHLALEALHALGGEKRFRELKIAALGWVDGDRAAAMFRNLLEDERAGKLETTRWIWPLWMLLGVEIWYTQAITM